MLKEICIIVLVACVGVMIYSIINAVKTSKRNKEADRNSRMIFMAQLQKDGKIPSEDDNNIFVTNEPDMYEDDKSNSFNTDFENKDENDTQCNGKSLKDFFI